MKILFLDIDGVLNSPKTWALYGDSSPLAKDQKFNLDPNALRFIQLLHAQGVEIVISSTWRLHENLGDFKDVLGFPVKGKTGREVSVGSVRGKEIDLWLKDHPEVEQYCIVDDDSDMLEEQMPYFVKTNYKDGLQFEHMEKICKIFGMSVFDFLFGKDKEVEEDFTNTSL
jgi:hypothetical protein